jgi:hypothetical protein
MSPSRPNPPLRTAIVYDYDGTLAPGNIQEHSFLPNYLGVTPQQFWDEVKARRKASNADQILIYMLCMLEHANAKNLPITHDLLRQHAKEAPLFDGVIEWFDRINDHAGARGLTLEHYVISSGNEEMIRATRIGDAFKYIFGCRYEYRDDEAIWPAVAINYTTKTQYLFRINKGVLDYWNDDAVNRWQPMQERPIPFSRMIYLGDGDTDIPSMKMVRHQGGHSVAVFDPTKWEGKDTQRKVYNLIAEDRAHFVVPADYTIGSQLDVTIKGILGRIARDEAGYRGGAAD